MEGTALICLYIYSDLFCINAFYNCFILVQYGTMVYHLVQCGTVCHVVVFGLFLQNFSAFLHSIHCFFFVCRWVDWPHAFIELFQAYVPFYPFKRQFLNWVWGGEGGGRPYFSCYADFALAFAINVQFSFWEHEFWQLVKYIPLQKHIQNPVKHLRC